MEYSEENKFQPKLVCNKGDMLLYEIMSPSLTKKAYNLKFDLKNLDTSKVNIDTFLSISLYELLETLNNIITFYNKDLKFERKDLIQKYLDTINLDTSRFDAMIFNFGKTQITLYNNERQPFSIDSNNQHLIDAKFSMDFQLTVEDDLPIYMNNIIGLMFKKMFYNVKLFIEKL